MGTVRRNIYQVDRLVNFVQGITGKKKIFKKMKCSTAICLLLAGLSTCAAKKKKPLTDEKISEMQEDIFECWICLREYAPQCIPPCIPDSYNLPCFECLWAAGKCLKDCGYQKTAEKLPRYFCEGNFDAKGECGVAKDNCEDGFVAVPRLIPLL